MRKCFEGKLTPLSSAFIFLFSGRLVAMFSLRCLCWVGISLFIVGLAIAFIFPNECTFIVFYAMLALGEGIALWRTPIAADLLIGAGFVGFACGGLGGTVPV